VGASIDEDVDLAVLGPGGEQATAVALSQVRRQASPVRSAEAP